MGADWCDSMKGWQEIAGWFAIIIIIDIIIRVLAAIDRDKKKAD
jgi:hypothetical protein